MEEALIRKYEPRLCGTCNIPLKVKSQSRKGYCSPMCEIKNSYEVSQNGCWIWNNKQLSTGYGYVCLKRRKLLAHRIIYEYYKGKIEERKVVRHLCNNCKCINPDHLEIGSQSDNVKDAIKAGTMKTKLSWEEVKTMRDAYKSGESIANLRKLYKVDYKTVKDILLLKKWKPENYAKSI